MYDTPVTEPDEFATTDRRAFLARAATLSLAIPGLAAACSRSDQSRPDGQGAEDSAAASARTQHPHNSDSRLDSTLLRGKHSATSATGTATHGAESTLFHRWNPVLPPAPASGRLRLHWHAREVPVRISDDTVVAGWTFEGDIPGPLVHCRVGDRVEFTLTNDTDIPHSMDFHAAQIDPKTAFRSVPRGESVTYTFSPRRAGAFLYHCGTAPVLMHIGAGMFGAIIVTPRTPLAPATNLVLVQNEYYLAGAVNGVRASDYQKMLNSPPDTVCFNGRPNQYVKEPIHVKTGDRVRFWVVGAGPSHPCYFHVVGEQFDKVYLGAPPGNSITGVQTFIVPPGGGAVYELVCDVPGEFPFVNHAFGHGQKGAIGLLVVDG